MCHALSTVIGTSIAVSYTACHVELFLLAGGWRICVVSRAFIAGGCTYAFEAAHQGKTTVVTGQTVYSIRQASSTSQTRQSRLLPFVKGVQPPSWTRRHPLSKGESTQQVAVVCGAWIFPGGFLAVRGHLALCFST